MSFLASVGVTNVDLMYVGMPRVPQEGEEIFSQDFRVLLGGGAPGTAVNAARLGIPTRLATYLGSDLFSGFARAQFEQNGVSPYNLAAEGETGIPVNVTSAHARRPYVCDLLQADRHHGRAARAGIYHV